MADDFGRLSVELDYPMAVVTCAPDGEPSGCLVGFASQCSIHPPLVMVWVSRQNHTHGPAGRSTHLGVHFLSVADRRLAELFGAATGDETDKFARCAWHPGPAGVPVLDDCARWLVGAVQGSHDTGDHTGFLLSPVAARAGPWAGQLGFQAVRGLPPGHPA